VAAAGASELLSRGMENARLSHPWPWRSLPAMLFEPVFATIDGIAGKFRKS